MSGKPPPKLTVEEDQAAQTSTPGVEVTESSDHTTPGIQVGEDQAAQTSTPGVEVTEGHITPGIQIASLENPGIKTENEDKEPALEVISKKPKSKKDPFNVDGNNLSEDELAKNLENINFDESIVIRLQKLRQQYATQTISTKIALESDKFLDDTTIETIIKSTKDNIEKHQTTDYDKRKRPERYDDKSDQIFRKASKDIHLGVTANSTINNLTITLPDNSGTINADFLKDQNKILFSCTAHSDQALILMIETALKAAKNINGKCNFVIYPNNDYESIVKLCAMAKSVGLNPVFKEHNPPGSPTLEEFKRGLQEKHNTSDPLKLANTLINEKFKEDEELKPKEGYQQPPAPPSVPKKSK